MLPREGEHCAPIAALAAACGDVRGACELRLRERRARQATVCVTGSNSGWRRVGERARGRVGCRHVGLNRAQIARLQQLTHVSTS